jgi:hypothetical protein
MGLCLYCSKPFLMNPRCKREQKFCSDVCRKLWWNVNVRPKSEKKVELAKKQEGDLELWFRSRKLEHAARIPKQRITYAWLYWSGQKGTE